MVSETPAKPGRKKQGRHPERVALPVYLVLSFRGLVTPRH